MGDQPDKTRLASWKAFLKAYRGVLDRLEEELLTGRGLSLSWYDVLVQLAGAPDRRLSMRQLAESVLLSPSGVTRLVDKMEDAGFVARMRCPHDRRIWFVILTDAGLEELRSSAPMHLEGVERHFARHLSKAEANMLTTALTRMSDALQQAPSQTDRPQGMAAPSS
jgi:DNA-binding MarR family transcriptional regulator